jgi:phosphate-selective porin OprO/OprP
MKGRLPAAPRLPILTVLLWTAAGVVPARAADATGPAAARPPTIEAPNLFQAGWRDPRYAIPDLAEDRIIIPRLNTRFLTIRPGIELIFDHTTFRQDEASVAQVGQQGNLLEVRSASLEFAGAFGPKMLFDYKVGIEYNGFDVDPETDWAITDFNVAFAIPRWRTRVRIGQMREDFGYEIVGSTATMPQSERVLAPFASPINFGVKVTHVLGSAERGTLTYGLFKDDWGDREGKPALSARATFLAIDQPGHWLHVGVSFRRAGIGDDLRYRGRPGVSAADDYVDTGAFAASSATHVGLEGHYAKGPFSVIGEYSSARPDISTGETPTFSGGYLLGSWVITGEQRAYDRSRGTVKRVMPQGRWGAPELVARYAFVDLSSEGIDGGRFDRIEIGANWWATTRWKFGLLYGHIWLRRFGETGTTDSLLTRLQWIY